MWLSLYKMILIYITLHIIGY